MSAEKNRMQKLAGIPLNEAEEIETINTAKKGDYIVKNPTGEEYVLTPEKFKKNYYVTPISDDENSSGYKEFENRPEERNVVEVTKDVMSKLEDEFKSTPSQENFFDFAKNLKTKKAEKSVKVKARIADKEEKVVTVTKSNSENKSTFKFKASWGEDMILKQGDFLVVSSDEVYRIGQKEFESTYKFKEK